MKSGSCLHCNNNNHENLQAIQLVVLAQVCLNPSPLSQHAPTRDPELHTRSLYLKAFALFLWALIYNWYEIWPNPVKNKPERHIDCKTAAVLSHTWT